MNPDRSEDQHPGGDGVTRPDGAPMRILIVKTSSLGDVVHNLPMVSDIRARIPRARIDWLVERAFADIPALHAGVHAVIPIELRRWLRAPWKASTWQGLGDCRKHLRAQRYDLILDSQGLLKSALAARLARGPVYGPDPRSAREGLAGFLYTRGLPMRWDQHAVSRNRALAAAALAYPVPADAPDYGIDPPDVLARRGPYCVALHATSRDSKRWPADHWIALARALADHGLTTLLPSGSAREQADAEAIARGIGPQAQALPRQRIRDLAAILGQAQAVIGVDTGLVHLAAALGRPTVGIFRASDPAQTGVLAGDRARNLGGFGACPPVQAVVAALKDLGVLPS